MATKKPVKKQPAKKPASKAASTKTTAKKTDTTPKVRSFRVSKNEKFFSPRITAQTIYWSILSLVILGLFLWTVQVQLETVEVIESLNTNY